MSEKWIVAGAVGASGIVGAAYVAYKYFVGPGQGILGQYKLMLEDIMKETKQFITDNSRLSPPVVGLLPWQEALIQKKKEHLALIQPQVVTVLNNARLDPQAWTQQLFTMIAEIVIGSAVVGAIVALIRSWWSRPAARNLQSADSHLYYAMELITQEFALSGSLNLASGLQTSLSEMYNVYTAVDLVNEAIGYQGVLATLTPGSVEYLVYSQLLTYVQAEISATMGIVAQIFPFWSPI